jgi:predicted acylesterase/phospholipase RssA
VNPASSQPTSHTILFQSAKLGDVPHILNEFKAAARLLRSNVPIARIYGVSGGALVALAFALALAARRDPARWAAAASALQEWSDFLRQAKSSDIRAFNLNPLYGPFRLDPLRRWAADRLRAYCGRDDLALSALPVPLYLCAMDWDGVFTPLGPPDERLQFPYHHVHVGPPEDAPILDALIAALSTMLSTEPTLIHTEGHPEGQWLRDCRPAIVDAGAIVADLEADEPYPLLRSKPHAPIRPWKLNWITSSFIMHSKSERNHILLTAYYLDLERRHLALQKTHCALRDRWPHAVERADPPPTSRPHVGHIDLPYVGSTEASANMRNMVENKAQLTARFERLVEGQAERFPFDQPANVIYGAGGSSGILAGLVATRAVHRRFAESGGEICQIYGVSAGIINAFFHAIRIAAARHPDLYAPAAHAAIEDLETFITGLKPADILRLNLNPIRFWHGWTNLGPLKAFLLDRLGAYTGSAHPEQITFDDIALPLTVTVSREDGYVDMLGMTTPDRRFYFGDREWQVRPAAVVQAIVAGWSMNTYVEPTTLGDQTYVDGGGTFYDPALFVACADPELTNLLNIHVDDPDGHSYRLPPRPNLVRVVFDTHNYIFPEERRRMRALTHLMYQHYRLRAHHAACLTRLPPQAVTRYPLFSDFRRQWRVDNWNL